MPFHKLLPVGRRTQLPRATWNYRERDIGTTVCQGHITRTPASVKA
jgi:hypothetical protein